jgi:hypothetical protein
MLPLLCSFLACYPIDFGYDRHHHMAAYRKTLWYVCASHICWEETLLPPVNNPASPPSPSPFGIFPEKHVVAWSVGAFMTALAVPLSVKDMIDVSSRLTLSD